ncbi:MAG: ABC transporter ATP-binding protein [Gammaproteobacteria bacterium]
MSDMITARGLVKNYGSTRAMDNVSFAVERGRIVGLVGPNGAGKTTALRAILGLTDFDGDLSVLGLDPRTDRSRLMERVCFVADIAVLPRWLRVNQALDFMENVHPRFNREKAKDFLSRTNIVPKHRVKELSKGMIAQLHLALVMAIDAELLVLDEPTLGLDILYRKKFYESLLSDYFDDTKTIVVTTHQIEEIENILTDVLFIRNGRIVLENSVEDLAEAFTEVLVKPEHADTVRRMNPIHERGVFGKQLFLFEGVSRSDLEPYGEIHTPGISDIFVAKMEAVN